MIIYRCDKCGAEHQHKGIVTNMHKQFGYEQLTAPINGITDVCKDCFKQISKAYWEADKAERESKRSRMLAILGLGK